MATPATAYASLIHVRVCMSARTRARATIHRAFTRTISRRGSRAVNETRTRGRVDVRLNFRLPTSWYRSDFRPFRFQRGRGAAT